MSCSSSISGMETSASLVIPYHTNAITERPLQLDRVMLPQIVQILRFYLIETLPQIL